MSKTDFVSIIDPLNVGGLLKVPISKTFDTKGRAECLKGLLTKNLSLCCLFQRGKCHAGVKCHQVHADRNFVAELRAQCQGITSCCARCGDTATGFPAGKALFHELTAAQCTSIRVQGGSRLALDQAAFTVGFAQLFSSHGLALMDISHTVVIPAPKVCRLHLRGACKYGKDCKNVHICSKLGESCVLENKLTTVAAQVIHDSFTGVEPVLMKREKVERPKLTTPVQLPAAKPSAVRLLIAEPEVSTSAPQANEEEASFVAPKRNHSERRHSFGSEFDEIESVGPNDTLENISFDTARVSSDVTTTNFLFRWTHPANISPIPTCVASDSLRLLMQQECTN